MYLEEDKLTEPMLNVAIQAVKKAGDFIIKQYELINQNNSYLSTNYINAFISKLHMESENIITKIINKFYPLHIVNVNKNYTLWNKNNNKTYWIIESIDNNINFIKQLPFFTLSIAVQCKKQIEIGVIYDPIHNELFSACKGKGAQCNGYRMRLKNQYNFIKYLNTIILSISSTNFQDNITAINNILHLLNKQNIEIDFRRSGSIVLDLAYVAIGRLDACLISLPKKNQKIASGILIVKESGGFITDFNGNEIHYSNLSKTIIAGNVKIIKAIITLVKNHKIL